MITLDTLQVLYEYNYWARDRQLAACERLAHEQFVKPMGGSFRSLRDTLVHLAGVEWLWLERWRGRDPREIFNPEDFPEPDPLRRRWREVESGMRSFLGGLVHDDLAGTRTYTTMTGQAWTYPLGHMMLHLANHQTYHRGQVTTLLRQLGAIPAPVDFLLFLDSKR